MKKVKIVVNYPSNVVGKALEYIYTGRWKLDMEAKKEIRQTLLLCKDWGINVSLRDRWVFETVITDNVKSKKQTFIQDHKGTSAYCDLILNMKNEIGKTCSIKSNKLLLGLRSRYFRSMFTREWNEQKTNICTINDIPYEDFGLILLFLETLQTSQFYNVAYSKLLQFLEVSFFYQIPLLEVYLVKTIGSK
eukprot:UN27487